MSGLTATIFGCTGFLGRYVAQALGKMGTTLVLPHRCDPVDAQHLKTMGDAYMGSIVMVHDFDIRNDDHIKKAMEKSNIVINLIGADRETWNFKFEEVHIEIAERIAKAAKAHGGIQRFIHVSALGAAKSAPSRRLQTKAAGEEVVQGTVSDISTIFRLAPMTGTEDRLFNSWAQLAKKVPALPLIDGGKRRVQPVWIRDVSQGIINSLYTWDSLGKTYELAGPDVFSVKDMVNFVFETIREPHTGLPVPSKLMKLMAAPGDWMSAKTPFRQNVMFTEDYVNEQAVDLVLDADKPDVLHFADLDLNPHRVTEGLPIEYLRFYRSGGYDFGSTQTEQL